MSNPDPTARIFDSLDPLVDSGEAIEIRVSQTLTRAKNDGNVHLLETTGAESVHIRVEGPQVELLGSDVVGVFPSPGSDNSPDEFLPHIALSRRTLPWERQGPKAGTPWLALIVLKQSEIGGRFTPGGGVQPITPTTVGAIEATHPAAHAQFQGAGLTNGTPIDVVFAPTGILQGILVLDDLKFLCHVRRLAQDNPLAKLDDDRDVAVVVSGRLPDAFGDDPQLHHAYLVSLEKRSDLPDPGGTTTPLIVLHHWSFTPSKGGDFEQVAQAIRARPNGGVLRFGNLPRNPSSAHPELSDGFAGMLDDAGFLLPPAQLHQEGSPVEYRGPLRPFAPPPRQWGFAVRPAPEEFIDSAPGDPPDYSHAAAFELGRLATLAGEGLVDDLHRMRYGAIISEIEVPVLVEKLPDAFQMPEWIVNPSDPYTLPGNEPLLKTGDELLQLGGADPTGIAVQSAPWKDQVVGQIDQLAGVAQPPVGQLEIDTVAEQVLDEMFADVVAITKSL